MSVSLKVVFNVRGHRHSRRFQPTSEELAGDEADLLKAMRTSFAKGFKVDPSEIEILSKGEDEGRMSAVGKVRYPNVKYEHAGKRYSMNAEVTNDRLASVGTYEAIREVAAAGRRCGTGEITLINVPGVSESEDLVVSESSTSVVPPQDVEIPDPESLTAETVAKLRKKQLVAIAGRLGIDPKDQTATSLKLSIMAALDLNTGEPKNDEATIDDASETEGDDHDVAPESSDGAGED